MSLAFTIYFPCPRCGLHVDVGEASEDIRPKNLAALAERRARIVEGTCVNCQARVEGPVNTLRSRARN